MTAIGLQRLRRVSLWQPLAVRDFRLLWLSQTVSLLGDQFHFIALSWLTLKLTGSGLALGSVLMVASVPRAAFMLVGGALTDRVSPRAVMLASNALRALLVAVLAALIAVDGARLWHLYLIAAAFGVVGAFFHPAFMTMTPRLVGKQQLEAGNALMRGSAQLSVLLGPAPAGALIALVGVAAAFAVDAATFVFAAAMIWLMAAGRAPAALAADSGGRQGLLRAIAAGFRYAWADPAVRAALLLVAVIDFAFVGPFNVGVVSLAEGRFAGGAVALGLMLSAWGAGALLGTLVAGLTRPRRRGLLLAAVAAVIGLGLALLGLAPSVVVAAALIGGMGFGSGLINVAAPSWLQARTDPAYLGRVMSLVSFASLGLAPVSFAVAGALVDVHATVMFAVAGLLVLAAAGYALANPAVRAME